MVATVSLQMLAHGGVQAGDGAAGFGGEGALGQLLLQVLQGVAAAGFVQILLCGVQAFRGGLQLLFGLLLGGFGLLPGSNGLILGLHPETGSR